MKATILEPRSIRAAASVANGGYEMSTFQIKRVGDKAQVSGSNGYASISATVPARFNRWPDGKALTFGKRNVRAMMRSIGRNLKRSEKVDFGVAGDVVSVALDADGANTRASFFVGDDAMYGKLDRLTWKGGDCPAMEGDALDAHSLKLASYAMELLGLKVPCRVEAWPGRPYKLTAETSEVEACALVTRKGMTG